MSVQGSMLQGHAGEVPFEDLLLPSWSPSEPSLFRRRNNNIRWMWHKKGKKPMNGDGGGELEEKTLKLLSSTPVSKSSWNLEFSQLYWFVSQTDRFLFFLVLIPKNFILVEDSINLTV